MIETLKKNLIFVILKLQGAQRGSATDFTDIVIVGYRVCGRFWSIWTVCNSYELINLILAILICSDVVTADS